ncbi:MAG: hypothetical protein EHM40_01770 [Chloroflexi bacterium]|nr:MAG: hypothetical protein EHM40_22190 [Chloroflexota bacterium]RPI96216.1 MAG: hypothetical protein EHM40_01770 [Chloroflexota bacterium]
MRKSTIFISAVLTTFALVMLYRIASAYTDKQKVTEVAAEPTATLEPIATEPPVATEVALSPEEAAQVAAQVVGNTNLLSAESSIFDGLDAWMITFTNNDVVYVGLDGQVLGVQVAPVVVNVAPPVKQKKKNNGGGGGGGGNSNQESREDRDSDDHEHEDEDDD